MAYKPSSCSWLLYLLALNLCLSMLPTSMGFQTLILKPSSHRNGRSDNNVVFLGNSGARPETLSTTFRTMTESRRHPGNVNLKIGMSMTRVEITKEREPVASDYAMGFSFSVAGLLFPYHLGVADYLKENQLIVQGTPLSGSSGGALAAALIALSFSGLDLEKVLDTTQTAYTELRLSFTIYEFDITAHRTPCSSAITCVDHDCKCLQSRPNARRKLRRNSGKSARGRLGRMLTTQLEEILPLVCVCAPQKRNPRHRRPARTHTIRHSHLLFCNG